MSHNHQSPQFWNSNREEIKQFNPIIDAISKQNFSIQQPQIKQEQVQTGVHINLDNRLALPASKTIEREISINSFFIFIREANSTPERHINSQHDSRQNMNKKSVLSHSNSINDKSQNSLVQRINETKHISIQMDRLNHPNVLLLDNFKIALPFKTKENVDLQKDNAARNSEASQFQQYFKNQIKYDHEAKQKIQSHLQDQQQYQRYSHSNQPSTNLSDQSNKSYISKELYPPQKQQLQHNDQQVHYPCLIQYQADLKKPRAQTPINQQPLLDNSFPYKNNIKLAEKSDCNYRNYSPLQFQKSNNNHNINNNVYSNNNCNQSFTNKQLLTQEFHSPKSNSSIHNGQQKFSFSQNNISLQNNIRNDQYSQQQSHQLKYQEKKIDIQYPLQKEAISITPTSQRRQNQNKIEVSPLNSSAFKIDNSLNFRNYFNQVQNDSLFPSSKQSITNPSVTSPAYTNEFLFTPNKSRLHSNSILQQNVTQDSSQGINRNFNQKTQVSQFQERQDNNYQKQQPQISHQNKEFSLQQNNYLKSNNAGVTINQMNQRIINNFTQNQQENNQFQQLKERSYSHNFSVNSDTKQSSSINKPSLHLGTNTQITPKLLQEKKAENEQQNIAQYQNSNNNLNSNNNININNNNTNSNNDNNNGAIFKSVPTTSIKFPGQATIKFPQPSHYDRDSYKTKRSSNLSSARRSEGDNSSQQSATGSFQRYDTLDYNKINSGETDKNIIDQIKGISSSFMSKTSAFFKNNFRKGSRRLGCTCDSDLKEFETCSIAYQWLNKQYKTSEFPSLKQGYEDIKRIQMPALEKCEDQIEKDIKRTFPDMEMFQDPNHINQLRSLLISVAKYDPKIGYVQGMNMIAASLLFHSEEYVAFWVLQIIFEKLEMRDIFSPDLPGLSKHLQLIDVLTLTRIPDLYSHLCNQGITYEMFCSPWILSLFGVALAPQKQALLFTQLMEEGWLLFYKLVLSFLCYNKEKLMKQDICELMTTLVQGNYKFDQQEHWEHLLKVSKNVHLDAKFINQMLESYNHEKKQFKIKPY